MVTSKHLITALEKSDWLDRLLIIAALAFFLLVVLFILKQRIVDRGLKVAFWWTRFIPSRSSSAANVADAMEKGSALTSSATAVISSVVTVASTLIPSVATSITSELPLPTADISAVSKQVVPLSLEAPDNAVIWTTDSSFAATVSTGSPHDEL
ncbi:hypothetical protein PHLCEN_2v8346 [Hermanssonia centrifuga]|uniref:Sec20 C-terminal domain-containing protein n=1 Tax=Hermanssonia centrifuga TaxID=98765 RepID=A0A2R6NUJ2_9APHY|nr:hypothetical protein PHLCEN_2v8346 [Hermanssonia centrifuga]